MVSFGSSESTTSPMIPRDIAPLRGTVAPALEQQIRTQPYGIGPSAAQFTPAALLAGLIDPSLMPNILTGQSPLSHKFMPTGPTPGAVGPAQYNSGNAEMDRQLDQLYREGPGPGKTGRKTDAIFRGAGY